jgi:hypothetical protein
MASTILPADITSDAHGLYLDVRANFTRAVTDIEAVQAVGTTQTSNISALQTTSQAIVSGSIATLVGTGVTYFVAPVAGTITAAYTVISGALTTGDATVTLAIGATPITNGVITVTQAASAAGDIDTCAPTAARTVVAGSLITATVGGTNDAVRSANIFIVISRY